MHLQLERDQQRDQTGRSVGNSHFPGNGSGFKGVSISLNKHACCARVNRTPVQLTNTTEYTGVQKTCRDEVAISWEPVARRVATEARSSPLDFISRHFLSYFFSLLRGECEVAGVVSVAAVSRRKRRNARGLLFPPAIPARPSLVISDCTVCALRQGRSLERTKTAARKQLPCRFFFFPFNLRASFDCTKAGKRAVGRRNRADTLAKIFSPLTRNRQRRPAQP